MKYVARQMLAVLQVQRKVVHAKWGKVFPHATSQREKDFGDEVVSEKRATRQRHETQYRNDRATGERTMRYISARQMIFDAYQTRRGNSPIAGLFDNFKRIRERVGDNGPKLRSITAEHKRNVRALVEAGPFDENLADLKRVVASSERRLSEMRTALEDVSKLSSEGVAPDNDWKIVHGLEIRQVISAVENQPQHLQVLARYCFGPFTRDELAEDRKWTLAVLMHVGMQLRLSWQGQSEHPPAQAIRQLRWIVSAAIHHHAEITYPYNRAGLQSPRRIAAWIEEEHGGEVDVRRWAASGRTCWKSV